MAGERKFTIGRANSCDIPIADDSISRVHAEITILAVDRLLLRDLGSQNGTVLIRQGREFRLGEETVFPGDTLRFGEVTLPAREVFDALAVHNPPVKAPIAADRPPDRQAVPSKPASASGPLVRCSCGAVKSKGVRCNVCGE